MRMPLRLCLFGFALAFLTATSCGHSQSTDLKGKVNMLISKLKATPQDESVYNSLHDLITIDYTHLTDQQRQEIRATLKKYTTQSHVAIAPKNEPGQKIILKGKVTNVQGKPIPDVLFTIYQTDHQGYYTPYDAANKTMGERDARLFGYLRTDAAGNYEINTIRPMNYPTPYKGRHVPQHIHIDTDIDGYKNARLQVVFKDDPVMDDYWRDWAQKFHYPIVTLIYNKNSTSGICNITLE